jgi:hypothetical protein
MARQYIPKRKVLGDEQRIAEKQARAESSPAFMSSGHELVKNILRQGRNGTPIPDHIIRNVLATQFKNALKAVR